jgi:hypothetical protein
MGHRVLVVTLAVSLPYTICNSQSVGGQAAGYSHRDLHANLQRHIPAKPGQGSIFEQIRDDGFGNENMNPPMLGAAPDAGCIPTDSRPCPQPPPKVSKTRVAKPAKP